MKQVGKSLDPSQGGGGGKFRPNSGEGITPADALTRMISANPLGNQTVKLSSTMLASNYLTASQTKELVDSGDLTVEQVIGDHRKRIEQRDKDVLAWTCTNFDAPPPALTKELCGITIGVKDIMNTADMPTQEGSPIYKDSQPGVDSAVVAICRAAGAIILGKTTTTAYAFGQHGTVTHNPVDKGHSPGGSSSGSGAAVADFQCHIALGTQTGGSMIRPASFCGIYGYKPTFGTICRDGTKICAISLDTIGFFARSISDIHLISRVFNIIEPTASPSLSPKSISNCSFGFVKTDQWDSLASDDLKEIWGKAQDLLRKAGSQVEDVALGPDFENLAGPNGRIAEMTEAEAQTNILREYRIGKDKLDSQVTSWAENGRGTTRQRLLQVQDEIAALRPKFDEIARNYSVLITPSVPGEAPEGLEWTGSPHFCSLWTALHVPAINVPGFAGSKGLPIGLTLVAPRSQDDKLLHVAKLVASIFAGADGGKLKHVPAPDGAVYVES